VGVTYITKLGDDRHMYCLIRNYSTIMLSSTKFTIVLKTTVFLRQTTESAHQIDR